ncbi:hypothetical protein COLO4_16763 [Corchorus olitorius]|uniref:Uncharacterized protein n=1 Tax=Corchorus olitorius TaxID=93759 RepID=A0A1R3JFN0_9ROSI|nr:hypothetical protein COLO4_16763 [Corchorus olitorius]
MDAGCRSDGRRTHNIVGICIGGGVVGAIVRL